MDNLFLEKLRSKISEVVKNEMEYFSSVIEEYPELKKYEKKVLEQFKKHYISLIDLVLSAHNGKIFPHNLVLNGAILRSLNLYRGVIWALGKRNPHVLYESLRAQCETLALIHYCVLNPDYIEAATLGNRKHPEEKLRIVNILTMIEKLDKKFNGIKKDYDDLCEYVHPNPTSLYANISPISDNEERIMIIGTTSMRITNEQADLIMRMLSSWTDWLLKELYLLGSSFGINVKS